MIQLIDVFHADSLTGPMQELKKAFERVNPSITIRLTAGRSKDLGERIIKGEKCDVFAPSDPEVIRTLILKEAAQWLCIFSQNEMVIITQKGNPASIWEVKDLFDEKIKVVCVTGEKDLASRRTVEFLRNIAGECQTDILSKPFIKVGSIPEALRTVKEGRADVGVVYLSAAVAEQEHLEWISFPSDMNLSQKIRNAVTVPFTAKYPNAAILFVQFIQSSEGRDILNKTGQPPVVPTIKEGVLPVELQ